MGEDNFFLFFELENNRPPILIRLVHDPSVCVAILYFFKPTTIESVKSFLTF